MKHTAIAITMMIFGTGLFAQKSCFTNDDNVVVDGYDIVSYWDGTAEKGTKDHAVEHGGANFYFSSASHAKSFTKDPMKYMPEYGGFCAYAMAEKDMKVPSNPTTFKVVDKKLYLFFNGEMDGMKMNTLMAWGKGDEKTLIQHANTNWKKMK